MVYNFITNIQNCYVDIPMMLYYSHIPSLIINLLLSFLVIRKSKTLSSKILFAISITFAIWIICNLTAWLSVNGLALYFAWSFFGIVTAMMFMLSAYLTFVYLFKRDIPFWTKILSLIVVLPIIVLTPTIYNLPSFNSVLCLLNENILFDTYYYAVGGLSFLLIIGMLIYKVIKVKDSNERKEGIIFALGIELFILMFFFTGFLSSYIASLDMFSMYPYNAEFYGMFGMDIFMAFLAYLIVRYQAFNVKLLGAQALVWSIGILVGSQLFFVKTTINMVLTSITLVITVVAGYILVRSVKKVDEQRIALAEANESQQVLIRFITHQVKGFFTKSKMVFASILEGDLGPISEEMKGMAQTGLDSDSQAVDMIQNILNASNLRTGKTQFTFEDVDMTGLVSTLIEKFKERIQTKGLNLDLRLPSHQLMANIDKVQFEQVVNNLVDNAINYTERGEIIISLSRHEYYSDSKIHFSVKDSGIGLSPKDKQNLFREGGRGEESVKVNVNSTGYGLFIVKKIVENLHGQIWAESAGRNLGTTFIVELPAK